MKRNACSTVFEILFPIALILLCYVIHLAFQLKKYYFKEEETDIPTYIKNTSSFDDSDKKHNERKILINPKIISMKGHTRYWEACLRCLDNMGLVDRPYEIVLEYYDIKGNRHEEIIAGFPATIVCHELDHLDGILHIDKAIEVLKMKKDDRKVFRDSHPYEIISEN